MQRYFGIDKKNHIAFVGESDMHHIKHVMRMKEHDKIEVVLDSEVFLCELKEKNNDFEIHIIEKIDSKKEYMKYVTLIIPVLKEQKMDFILQKATELGVSEIIPVIMKRSIIKVDGKEIKKIERWNKIIKEAGEQSKRHNLPILDHILTLEEICQLEGQKMMCSTVENENTFKKFLHSFTKYDKLNIVIGPEGGLDIAEELMLQKNGFVPVTLGPRIMRVETVPIYILSVLNYEYME